MMMTQERADVGMYWKRGVRRPNANSTNAATSMTCYPLQCILGTDNIKLTFQQQNIFLMTTRLQIVYVSFCEFIFKQSTFVQW